MVVDCHSVVDGHLKKRLREGVGSRNRQVCVNTIFTRVQGSLLGLIVDADKRLLSPTSGLLSFSQLVTSRFDFPRFLFVGQRFIGKNSVVYLIDY